MVGGLREMAAPFVVTGPSGVAVRTRFKGLTPEDEEVLRLVGAHLGSLASRDLKARCVEVWSTPPRRGRPGSGR